MLEGGARHASTPSGMILLGLPWVGYGFVAVVAVVRMVHLSIRHQARSSRLRLSCWQMQLGHAHRAVFTLFVAHQNAMLIARQMFLIAYADIWALCVLRSGTECTVTALWDLTAGSGNHRAHNRC
jgi:hypothetical protein